MKGPSSQMQTTTKATLPDVIPATMRAATLLGAGGPDMLRVEDRPVPMPGPAQMLIRTAWAGVNPHDCAQRQRGSGPAGQTDILGLEVSGIVAGVGEGVDERMIGERVVALVMGGGNAEWCIAEEKLVLPLPDHISFREGGALPEGMFTAWFNVMEAGRLAHGEWLLVHGGTGGVGSAAIQIAVACGARVISTGGSAEKQAIARELGATLALNYRTDDVAAAVAEATGGRGVNVILETTGGAHATSNLDMLARDGRIAHISGRGTFSPPLGMIMQKRAVITGSLMRAMELPRKIVVATLLRERIWPRLGRPIRPLIDREFALADVAEAHRRVDAGDTMGRVLLRVWEPEGGETAA